MARFYKPAQGYAPVEGFEFKPPFELQAQANMMKNQEIEKVREAIDVVEGVDFTTHDEEGHQSRKEEILSNIKESVAQVTDMFLANPNDPNARKLLNKTVKDLTNSYKKGEISYHERSVKAMKEFYDKLDKKVEKGNMSEATAALYKKGYTDLFFNKESGVKGKDGNWDNVFAGGITYDDDNLLKEFTDWFNKLHPDESLIVREGPNKTKEFMVRTERGEVTVSKDDIQNYLDTFFQNNRHFIDKRVLEDILSGEEKWVTKDGKTIGAYLDLNGESTDQRFSLKPVVDAKGNPVMDKKTNKQKQEVVRNNYNPDSGLGQIRSSFDIMAYEKIIDKRSQTLTSIATEMWKQDQEIVTTIQTNEDFASSLLPAEAASQPFISTLNNLLESANIEETKKLFKKYGKMSDDQIKKLFSDLNNESNLKEITKTFRNMVATEVKNKKTDKDYAKDNVDMNNILEKVSSLQSQLNRVSPDAAHKYFGFPADNKASLEQLVQAMVQSRFTSIGVVGKTGKNNQPNILVTMQNKKEKGNIISNIDPNGNTTIYEMSNMDNLSSITIKDENGNDIKGIIYKFVPDLEAAGGITVNGVENNIYPSDKNMAIAYFTLKVYDKEDLDKNKIGVKENGIVHYSRNTIEENSKKGILYKEYKVKIAVPMTVLQSQQAYIRTNQ